MIGVIEDEGRRLFEAADRRGPQAPVPACPGWTINDLTAHVGWVYRWVGTIVGEGRESPPSREDPIFADPEPTDPEGVVARSALAHGRLVAALRDAPPDLRCWTTWSVPGAPRDFWIRRMVHETLVHRVDASDDGTAGPTLGRDLDPEVAADGIDEMVCGFARRFEPHLRTESPALFTLRPTDAEGSWWIQMSAEPATFGSGAPPTAPDAHVEGAAGELLLFLWNRRTIAGLSVTGDGSVLDAWRLNAHL